MSLEYFFVIFEKISTGTEGMSDIMNAKSIPTLFNVEPNSLSESKKKAMHSTGKITRGTASVSIYHTPRNMIPKMIMIKKFNVSVKIFPAMLFSLCDIKSSLRGGAIFPSTAQSARHVGTERIHVSADHRARYTIPKIAPRAENFIRESKKMPSDGVLILIWSLSLSFSCLQRMPAE